MVGAKSICAVKTTTTQITHGKELGKGQPRPVLGIANSLSVLVDEARPLIDVLLVACTHKEGSGAPWESTLLHQEVSGAT